MTNKIIYTHTDEAPALATYSLLPIVRAFTHAAGITVETRDISLAGRILASFPDEPDAGAAPGRTTSPSSASSRRRPRRTSSSCRTSARRSRSCKAAIKELQQQGYAVPDYPEDPQNDAEKRSRRATPRCSAAR